MAMRINTISGANVQQWKIEEEQLLGVTRKAFSGYKMGEGRIVMSLQ
jgi:hypothetical protein